MKWKNSRLLPLAVGMSQILIMTGWFALTSAQYINIATSTPIEGQHFQLDCIIAGFDITGNHGLLWLRDDREILWSQDGSFTDLDMTGDYTWKEYTDTNGIVHFQLHVAYFTLRHIGLYECLVALGDITNHVEVVSKIIQVNIGATSAPGYFPDMEWPKCYPQEGDFRPLIYTNTTIKCISTPGNPVVKLRIFRDGIAISDANTIPYANVSFIERTHTFTVTAFDHGHAYQCQIYGQQQQGLTPNCNYGVINVRLFLENTFSVRQGSDAVISCAEGNFQHILGWSFDREIQPSRLNYSDPNKVRITNMQMSDNGTLVTCRITDVPDIRDELILIVIARDMITEPVTTDGIATSWSGRSSQISESLDKSSFTSTITQGSTDLTTSVIANNSTVSPNMDMVIIIIAGGGGAFMLLLLILIIVACFFCSNKSHSVKSESEEGEPTRISTGYVWDRELSEKLKDSPSASPKVCERRHYQTPVTQSLQQAKEERSNSMSPSLMFAMTHLSDGDDTLKKQKGSETAHASIEKSKYKNVNRLSSIHPDFHEIMSGPAPSGQAPLQTILDAPESEPTYAGVEKSSSIKGPIYAVPEKGSKPNGPIYAVPGKSKSVHKHSIPASVNHVSKEDGGTGDSPYAIVHPDPENPMIRAMSKRNGAGVVNGAYNPDEEEGFVDNKIYEPAGPNP